ncbi:MAG: hypothetical protein ACP5H2_00105 [Solirubrobacteraceae bacterium]
MLPRLSDETLIRNRAWVMMGVLVVVVVGASLLAGLRGQPGARPHVAFGSLTTTRGLGRGDVFVNGWSATGEGRRIRVAAGSLKADPRVGVLVVFFTPAAGERERHRTFTLAGSGTVTLLRPPNPLSEALAFDTTLRFVTANGQAGTLNLATLSVALSR